MTIDNHVLRERIRLLSSFLGEAISRQTGEQTLNTIETLRKGFIQQRQSIIRSVTTHALCRLMYSE